jgi:hypothetical protein
MSSFYITDAKNFTALTAKDGADDYTIAGGTLTIDSDVRYGPNCSPTTGPIGGITVDAAAGGALVVDGTKVRILGFNTGSGTVPAAGTTITQSGVSGELLCVMSSLTAAPTAAGASMPASGFIKLRNVTGGAFVNGALTGISATARGGGDKPGWIEVAAVNTAGITCSRLGSVTMTGAWFRPISSTGNYVDTDGTRNQQIQLPCNAGKAFYPGVWIETAAGSNSYEEWPNVANLVNSNISTSTERGRMVWVSDTGLLRIGHDGTNAVGMLPPTGCKIRIPNIRLVATNSTVGYGTNRVPEDYPYQRPAFNFTGNAPVSMDKVASVWSNNFQQAYSLSLTYCAFMNQLNVQAISTPCNVSNCIVADRDTSVPGDYNMATFVQLVAGGTIDDNVVARLNTTGSYVYTVRFDGNAILAHRNRAHNVVTPNNSYNFPIFYSGTDCVYQDNESIGGSLWLDSLYRSKIKGTKFASVSYGTVPSSPTFNLFDAPATPIHQQLTIDGLSWLVSTTDGCHPNGYIFKLAAGAYRVTMRNIGTAAAPLDLGSTNATTKVLVLAYQAIAQKIAMQRVFTTACRDNAASFESDYGLKNYGLENCRSLGTDNLSLKQPNGYIRALRSPSAPYVNNATVGMHWMDYFTSDTVGAISVLLTDPTSETTAQVTVLAGSPKFTGDGKLICKNVGDSIKFTMKYWAQGHTALSTFDMTYPGQTNYLVEFRTDLGSGWSSWQVVNPTNLAAVSINPVEGVRVDVRITCQIANADPIDTLRFNTASTLTAQTNVAYPLDPVPVSISGIVSGSRLFIKRTDTDEVLFNDIVTGTSFVGDFDLADVPIRIELRKASEAPYYQPWFTVGTVTDDGFTATALQVRDDQ